MTGLGAKFASRASTETDAAVTIESKCLAYVCGDKSVANIEQIFRHKRELSLQLGCEECLIDSEATVTVRVDAALLSIELIKLGVQRQ